FFEQTLLVQLVRDLLNEFLAAACDIGERGEHPHRRCVKRENPEQLDTVARGAFQEEVSGELLARWVDAFHLPDLLDQEPQRDFDHRAIERGAADARGQRDIADLAQQPAGERAGRSDHALRKRENVLIRRAGCHLRHLESAPEILLALYRVASLAMPLRRSAARSWSAPRRGPKRAWGRGPRWRRRFRDAASALPWGSRSSS